MLDIHAHLYWKSFDADRAAVIKRAREAGVEKIICVAANAEESKLAVKVAHQYDLVASVGIHPQWFNELGMKNQELRKEAMIHNPKSPVGDPGSSVRDSQFMIPSEVNDQIEQNISQLKKLAADPKVVAIGECGLEYFSHAPGVVITDQQRERQKKGFLMQIELAQELKLPLIIHCRPARSSYAHSVAGGDAYEDLYEILTHDQQLITNDKKDSALSRSSVISHLSAVILHCYMGDTEVTKKFLELSNIYFSFTGNITYPTKKEVRGTRNDLQETVKMIPLERLFVETDCPFLTPQPERGKRNEPAFVRHTFDKVCELKNVGKEALRETLVTNYGRVFER